MPNLKKCAFCGNDEIRVRKYPSCVDQHVVMCGMTDGGCGSSTRIFTGTIEDACDVVDVWNERIPTKRTLVKDKKYKICPHCGCGNIIEVEKSIDDVYKIKCNLCGVSSGGYIKKEDAVSAWNKEVI